MNRYMMASVITGAMALMLSSAALAHESNDSQRRQPSSRPSSRPSQAQQPERERRTISPMNPGRRESAPQAPQQTPSQRIRPPSSEPKPAPQATPAPRVAPSPQPKAAPRESAPRANPNDSLPRERRSTPPSRDVQRAPAPSQPSGPSQGEQKSPRPTPPKVVGPTLPERNNTRTPPPEFKVPASKGPRLATPAPRKELIDSTRVPSDNSRSNERSNSPGGSRGGGVRFPDAPRVTDPNRHDDRDDRGGRDDHRDRDGRWDRDDRWNDRGHRSLYRWDDDCWRRPVVYVPRRSHIVLGWDCNDDWYWRPSYGWCRRSNWCDPCDNLIVTSYRPSWGLRWSSWSGFGFRYSSWSDNYRFSVGYAPVVLPVYTSCRPVCGSNVLWDRPSVIVGGAQWFPGTYVNNTTIIGTGSGVYDPNLQPAQVATGAPVVDSNPIASELDRAAEAMQANRFDVAVEWLRQYVRDNPSDGKAMRWLSVALLSAKNPDDAAAMMRMAYSSDIGLAGEPINRFELGLNNTELRDLVVRATNYANTHDTGSSWLMVGVLMQAEGRENLASTMFDRAANAGCDPEIIERLKGVTN